MKEEDAKNFKFNKDSYSAYVKDQLGSNFMKNLSLQNKDEAAPEEGAPEPTNNDE